MIAKNIDGLCYFRTDENSEQINDAIRTLVSQIGLIANRCTGFSLCDFDSWALPIPAFDVG